ncbi:microcin C transport system permease protein [Aestuariispira insulae]|uniref:Microcin C transport system permease protein n=2 Tax=Aestuariispira insulae TaxID=1461337 RepID=A0A3D9HXM3_9PROT|nr:microcin C transport system permease protein [Aestuariispira insulae]
MATITKPLRHRVLGLSVSPVTWRRVQRFKANKRAYWSLWIFLALFFISLFADFIANDRPLVVYHNDQLFFPAVKAYPETAYGGAFETEADYNDPYLIDLIQQDGWMIRPIIPHRYDSYVVGLETPSPSPPTLKNWLGTDDQARDVVARLIYGFRISVLFGLILTLLSSVVGIAAGLIQGYFGGYTDLLGQRFIEVWGSLPQLFILMILASMITPTFWWLLGLLLLFSWTALTGVVRAETLRARNLEYVRAARALGVRNQVLMFRHILPNAMVATVTYLPFIASGSLVALTSLDFLGFGLPPGSPSLGEMLQQGRSNLFAPWLTFTAFFTVAIMLSLLVFIGEGVRDAFDPRKSVMEG